GFACAARADHFSIDVNARADEVIKSAATDTAGLGVKPRPRAVLEAKAGKTVTVKWTVTSTAKQAVVKDVLIHFFVVKEEKLGQATVPALDKNVAVESALTMDFKPKDKAKGDLSFKIDTPGTYLLRLETVGAATGAETH